MNVVVLAFWQDFMFDDKSLCSNAGQSQIKKIKCIKVYNNSHLK